ncbi:MAG: polysaccharide biosynthesis protein [Lachnospiraceae bacterium]|nr:polysaccharide biosynthesis protein [Lachnospiraceae bacterium]
MSSKRNVLVKNASFLMAAALISKVVGLLYKSPLTRIVGADGMAYYGLAQQAYLILLMIASYSIPQAVSKIIAEKLAQGEYRNAQKYFKGSLLYATVAGGAVALFCLVGASILIPSNQQGATLALRVLSPTIFLSGILGVYRGYFQAYRNMVPTSISQILEQFANAAFSILAAWFFIEVVAGSDKDSIDRWGAAGGTIGTGVGVVAALLFVLVVYHLNRKIIQKKIASDQTGQEESYQEVIGVILRMVTPIILSAFIYNVNGYIDGYLFSEILGHQGFEDEGIRMLYTEYSIYFLSIINIPLTLSSAAPTSMIPEVSAAYARDHLELANRKVDQAVQLSMFISIPSAVGLAVLSQPIVRILFPDTIGTAGLLLTVGAVTVVLNGLSNISNGVLQGIGLPNLPMRNAAIALVVDVSSLVVMLLTTGLGILAVVLAIIIYSVLICILNDRSMKKYLGYKNKWVDAYLIPFLASIPMALAAWLLFMGVYFLIPSDLLGLAVSVPLAAVVYVVLYIVIARVPEEELRAFPFGGILVRIAGILRIYG